MGLSTTQALCSCLPPLLDTMPVPHLYNSDVNCEPPQVRPGEVRDLHRILIAGHFGFPNGEGATARVHAYAKGLSGAGCDVRVVCLGWTERSTQGAKNQEVHGSYQGIPFVYAGGSPFRDTSFARRRLRTARAALQLARMARPAHGRGPADVILLSYDGPITSALWPVTTVMACRFAGSAFVMEKSEYPFVYAPAWTKAWAWVVTRTMYKLPDAVIVISTCLERYFLSRVRRGARVIRIPILVDLDEFHLSPAEAPDRDILSYAGNLDNPGEVEDLLESFGEVAARFPQWSLRIIGGSRDPRALDRFRARAADMGLVERVEFTGSVGRLEIPGLLREAAAFALPRASGIFSTAGFPTKLGEYLAMGKPVVVTATGDIPLYLRDGVDAYLVPPDDTHAFAARLAEVFADPSAAREVGERGRETARREFDIVSQCRRLADFMEEVGSAKAPSQVIPG